jgi:hypothetical protein
MKLLPPSLEKNKIGRILFLFFLFGLTIFQPQFGFTQTGLELDCGLNSTNCCPFSSSGGPSLNCLKQSSEWVNYYRLLNSHKPINYVDIKYIPINIVVFGNDDGSEFPFHIGQDMGSMATYYDIGGNEIPNPYPTTSNVVGSIDSWLNTVYTNPTAPDGNAIYFNGPLPTDDVHYNVNIINPSSLPDTKIRFIINHYYFYQNGQINNAQIGSTINGDTVYSQYDIDDAALSLHLGINPEAQEKLIVFCSNTSTFQEQEDGHMRQPITILLHS